MRYLLQTNVLVFSLLGAFVIEGATIFGRFALGRQANRDTPQKLRALTFGLRVHHAYLGVGALLAALAVGSSHHGAAMCLAVVGIALLASDLVHHFLVLWPMTGDHEFCIFYPE